MKKRVLIFMLTLLSISFVNAQKIEIDKGFRGYRYSQNGNYMSMKDLQNAVVDTSEALKLVTKAKSNFIYSTIFNLSGGFLIGYPLGQAISGKDVNWTMAGIGAGLAAIGITIHSGATKNIRQAVELHNETQISITVYELGIIGNANGIGMSVNF